MTLEKLKRIQKEKEEKDNKSVRSADKDYFDPRPHILTQYFVPMGSQIWLKQVDGHFQRLNLQNYM